MPRKVNLDDDPAPIPACNWDFRISREVDIASIDPRHLKMLVILERLCRDRSYCWPTNQTLDRLYSGRANRKPSGATRAVLAEMERLGMISRQMIDPGREGAGRLGIFLHVRLDHDKPVEEGPPPPPEAVERLRQTRERFGYLARKPAGGGARIQAGGVPENRQGGVPEFRQQKSNELEDERKEDDDRENESSSPQISPPEETPDADADDVGLAPLVAKAEGRFREENMARRVRKAVNEYGREWVEYALWGVERLLNWPYLLGILKNWKDEDGPPKQVIERARRKMQPEEPIRYHRKGDLDPRPSAEALNRTPAEAFLDDAQFQGFGVEIGQGGDVVLIDPKPIEVSPVLKRFAESREAVVEQQGAALRRRLEAIRPQVREFLASRREAS